MTVNLRNQKIYHDAFIPDGEYGEVNGWKPSIDEREIEDACEDEEGHYVPATPLGYRDYKISRIEGIKNILAGKANHVLTYEGLHSIVREDNTLCQYDKVEMVTIGNGGTMPLVVVGDDEEKFYLVDGDNRMYFIKYVPMSSTKRIVIKIELEVPSNITENMVACKFDNFEDEINEHLADELKDDEECKVTVFNCYED